MESFHAPARAKVPPESDLSSEQPKSASAGGFKDAIEDSLASDLTDIGLDILLTDIAPNRLKYKDHDDVPIDVDCEIGDTWTSDAVLKEPPCDYSYEDANPVEWIRAKAIKYLGRDKQRQTYNNKLQDLLLDIIEGINNNHEQGRALDQAHIERLQTQRDTSRLLEFCKEICVKHQFDLHILHQCLLEAHRRDLPSGSCKLLEERYKAYEEQLRVYHVHLQLVLDRGAGPWPLPEILQKIYKQHEKVLDSLHGRLLSIYEGKAGWNFFDMLERASQEKDLKALHLSLLVLHKQIAKRDMLLHDSSHMPTSSRADSIETERPTLDSYPGPIQECLPSQASGLGSEYVSQESRPNGGEIKLSVGEKPLGPSRLLLPDLVSLPPGLLDIEDMDGKVTGIGSKRSSIHSNGNSIGLKWLRRGSNHKPMINSGLYSRHASRSSKQLAGIGKVFNKSMTPLGPLSPHGNVSRREAPDEDSKLNTTEAQSTSSHESVQSYEQYTQKKPLALGAERVPASTPGETTESGGLVQPKVSGDTFVRLPSWKRAKLWQRGSSSIDEMSPPPKFFRGIYRWYSAHDAFRGIIPQSISSRLSWAVQYTSEFSSWTKETCRTNLPFLEPPLENGKVRVRWTCVSTSVGSECLPY